MTWNKYFEDAKAWIEPLNENMSKKEFSSLFTYISKKFNIDPEKFSKAEDFIKAIPKTNKPEDSDVKKIEKYFTEKKSIKYNSDKKEIDTKSFNIDLLGHEAKIILSMLGKIKDDKKYGAKAKTLMRKLENKTGIDSKFTQEWHDLRFN